MTTQEISFYTRKPRAQKKELSGLFKKYIEFSEANPRGSNFCSHIGWHYRLAKYLKAS